MPGTCPCSCRGLPLGSLPTCQLFCRLEAVREAHWEQCLSPPPSHKEEGSAGAQRPHIFWGHHRPWNSPLLPTLHNVSTQCLGGSYCEYHFNCHHLYQGPLQGRALWAPRVCHWNHHGVTRTANAINWRDE